MALTYLEEEPKHGLTYADDEPKSGLTYLDEQPPQSATPEQTNAALDAVRATNLALTTSPGEIARPQQPATGAPLSLPGGITIGAPPQVNIGDVPQVDKEMARKAAELTARAVIPPTGEPTLAADIQKALSISPETAKTVMLNQARQYMLDSGTWTPDQEKSIQDAQKAPPDDAAKIVAGMEHGAAGLVSFFATPLGIATLGLAAAPAAIQKTGAVLYGLYAAKQWPETLGQFLVEQDPEKKGELGVQLGTQTGMVLGGGFAGHGFKTELDRAVESIPTPSLRTSVGKGAPLLDPAQLAAIESTERPSLTPATDAALAEVPTSPVEAQKPPIVLPEKPAAETPAEAAKPAEATAANLPTPTPSTAERQVIENAIKKGIEQKNDQPEHPNGGQGGETAAPSSSDSNAPSREVPQEVAAPRLRRGQKQGDLLGGSEDLTLVGERAVEKPPAKPAQPSVQETVADAVRAYGDIPTALDRLQDQIDHPDTSPADKTRLKAAQRHLEGILEDQSRREQTAEHEEAMTGKHELIKSVKGLGGLPTLGEHGKEATGELRRVMEAKKGAFLSLFRKGALSLDDLRQQLNERGFNFDTPHEMIAAIEDSLTTGRKIMGEKYTGGPGAMGAPEAAEMRASDQPTGLKRAIVDTDRLSGGKEAIPTPTRLHREEIVRQAEDALDANPALGKNIVSKIVDAGNTAITERQAAILLVERQKMMNARRVLQSESFREDTHPVRQEEIRASLDDIENQLERLDRAQRAVGSTWSDVGRMYQNMIREDYTLEALEKKARAAKKAPLTADERATIAQQVKDIEVLQKKVDEAIELDERRQREADVARTHEATIKELEGQLAKQPRFGKEVFDIAHGIVNRWKADADLARVSLRERLGRTSVGVDPTIVIDVARILRAKVGEFGLERAEALTSLIAEFGDEVRPYFGKAWDKMQQMIAAEKAPGKVKELIKKGTKPKGEKTPVDIKARAKAEAVAGEELSHKTVYELYRAHIREELAKGNEVRGVEGANAALKAAYEDLKEYYPGLTEEQVRQAYTEYGKVKFPSKEADKVRLAEYREIGQLQQKIADLEAGKSPLHTGLQKAQRTQDVRLLTARLNELLKKYTGEPSPEKLASRNQAKVTALRNQIADLDRQLQTGEKPIAREALSDTPEIERLKAERDAMQAKLDEIEAAENPPKSEAQKQVESLAKQRDKVSKTLAGDIDPKTGKPFVALSQAAEDIKAEIVAMRQLAADMRKEAAKPGREAKADAAEIKRYEDAIKRYEEKTAKSDFSTKKRTPEPPRTAQAAQLKDILKARREVYEAAKKASKPVKSAEEIYNERRAKDIARQTAEVKARIASGNYAKPPKKVMPALSPQNVKAWTELQAKKAEAKAGAEKLAYENRTPAQKLIDTVVKVPWHFLTAVKIIGHGTVGMITHAGGLLWRPTKAVIYWRNFGRQFGMWTNKAYHERLIYNLVNDPEFSAWKDAGASIDPHKTYTDYGMYAKWAGKPTAGGQRGFDALKLTRMELCKKDWQSVPVEIKADPQAALETRKRIAEINNKATGAIAKGDTALGAIARHPLANAALFAPRLYATRWTRVVLDPIKTTGTLFDMASDRAFGTSKVSKADAFAATTKLKHAAEFTAVYVGALLTNQAILSAAGSAQSVNFKDPTKKDWLKFKAGGKDIIADGGLLDPVRLIGQVVVGDLIMDRTAKEEYRQGTRFQKAGGDILNYLRGKFNPTLGLIVDSTTGRDYTGRPLPFSLAHAVAGTKPEKATEFKPKYEWGEWLWKQGPIPLSGGAQVVYDEMRKKGLSDLQAKDLLHGAVVGAFGMTGAHISEDYSLNPKSGGSAFGSTRRSKGGF